MQRLLDILLSGIAILLFLPLFIPVIIILLFTGEKEVFFFQTRVGVNRSSIRLFKFATMLKNSEKIGTGTVTLKDDPRVLPFGKFLRKSKINELPQLFNVFLGDMSIIGPRPQTERCFKAFPINSQNKIVKVKPGLSGIGSIVFRDEEKMMADHDNPDIFYDQVIMPYKGMLEEWYVENKSIYNYFSLIFLTITVVISSKTSIVWKFYKNLPRPPQVLKKYMETI